MKASHIVLLDYRKAFDHMDYIVFVNKYNIMTSTIESFAGYVHLCAGFDSEDLLALYGSVIRPVLEYACPVWYTATITQVVNWLSTNFQFTKKYISEIYSRI